MCKKHVNQPDMNGPQKMRLKMANKTLLLRRKNQSWGRRWKIRKYWGEKTQKIGSPHHESELWKAIEANNELKLNVYEQQDDIKH